jgi:hypothetical protein
MPVVTVIPIATLLLFFIAQRTFIQGITTSRLRGRGPHAIAKPSSHAPYHGVRGMKG